MKPEPLHSAPTLATQTDVRTHLPDPIPADRLFAGQQAIQIAHRGETYHLRITKNGKLILTK